METADSLRNRTPSPAEARVRYSLAVLLVLAVALLGGCATETSSDPEPAPAPAESTETVAATDTAAEVPSAGKGNADVTYVAATQAEDGSWTFSVTVEHPDTGWEDYADGWDVVTLDGEVIKADAADTFTRLLAHPHTDEQPFTRSQSGLVMPDGAGVVVVRAHDIVDGYGGQEVVVDLKATSGDDFEVSR